MSDYDQLLERKRLARVDTLLERFFAVFGPDDARTLFASLRGSSNEQLEALIASYSGDPMTKPGRAIWYMAGHPDMPNLTLGFIMLTAMVAKDVVESSADYEKQITTNLQNGEYWSGDDANSSDTTFPLSMGLAIYQRAGGEANVWKGLGFTPAMIDNGTAAQIAFKLGAGEGYSGLDWVKKVQSTDDVTGVTSIAPGTK